MKRLLLFFSTLLMFNLGYSQEGNDIIWQKTFGGSLEDVVESGQQTSDGGFIMAGRSYSNDGDVTGNHGDCDFWVVKTNASGGIQWQKTYGGSGYDEAHCIKQTRDGGYIVVGLTASSDGDINTFRGYCDFWVIKINQAGIIEWQKTYGGFDYDAATSVVITPDGAYVIAGKSRSTDGDVTGNHGGTDFWLIKIGSSGILQWQKSFGGTEDDWANTVVQTVNGGFMLAGFTSSGNGDVTGFHGMSDFWLVKTDASGTMEWEKTYGGSSSEEVKCIQQTTDNGYVFTGWSYSVDGDKTGYRGGGDYWVVKTDQSGTIQWQKTFGGINDDIPDCVQQTTDGGYLVCGWGDGNGGDITGNHGYGDCWVVKTDYAGKLIWQKSYGGTNGDGANHIQQTSNGGLIIFGSSESPDGDLTKNRGRFDNWLIYTCYKDALFITIDDPSYCNSTHLKAHEEFTRYIWSTGDTTQTIEITAEGNYSVKATNSFGCTSEASFLAPAPKVLYNYEKICLVTVDEQTGKNMIAIEKTLNVGTDSIMLYRKDTIVNTYKLVATKSINEESLFIDQEANPQEGSYYYRIAVKNNACAKQSETSVAHRTIWLKALKDENNKVNLSWNSYEGLTVNNFQVLRSNNGGSFVTIANIPAGTLKFTDDSPPEGVNKYLIRGIPESSCSPTKSTMTYISSNIILPGSIGIDEDLATQIKLTGVCTCHILLINL